MSKHEDRISELPDDILIHIISHLNVREAAATSILTPRWRYLSTYTTRLHFPRPFETEYITYQDIDQDLIRNIPHHMLINRVLDSHRGIRIKEFRVYTYFLEGATIDKWFEFALAKDVEILHVHMEIGGSIYNDHYPLRENLNLMGEILNCLKELSLLGIDVNDGDIKLLLNKFPLLESLSIKHAASVRHVSIVGHSSSKLKHLELSHNYELIEIEIDNFVNLVSLWCIEVNFSLKIKNVPKLIEFSRSDDDAGYNCTCAYTLSEMPSSIYHQLQTLKIFISPYQNKKYKQQMPLQLNGLKNLELCMDDFDESSVNMSFNPMYIIRACPLLEKLDIKFSWYNPSLIEVNEDCEEYIDMIWCTKKVCPNLKKMKISGFIGSLTELKFIFSILKNVNTPEELVVETCDQSKITRKLVKEHAQTYFGLSAFKVVVI